MTRWEPIALAKRLVMDVVAIRRWQRMITLVLTALAKRPSMAVVETPHSTKLTSWDPTVPARQLNMVAVATRTFAR